MRRNIYYLLLSALITLIGTSACSDDNASQNETESKVIKPLQTWPINNETNVPSGTITVSITYNMPVTATSMAQQAIAIEGATVMQVATHGEKVDITLSGLKKAAQYKLIVPSGTFVDAANGANGETIINFTTVKQLVATKELVTENSLIAAMKLYDYLWDNYGAKTLSGAMANVAWNIEQAERVYKVTGKMPAVAWFDYIHIWASPTDWIDYSDIAVAEKWWNEGGIIGAAWHWNVPQSESTPNELTYDPNQTTFTVGAALQEGTWENQVMKNDLAEVAAYLKQLNEKGIPVLWRPLHEAAGNIYEYSGGSAWFWWGADGPENFKRLWIYMFDYFKQQGINNLIWIWTSQTKDEAFYPGDEYVDMIARDLYGKTAAETAAEFETLTKQYDKMITLGECGAYIDEKKPMDYIGFIWDAGAKWSFFMPWYDNTGATMLHATDIWWKEALSNKYVITRDQLPSFK